MPLGFPILGHIHHRAELGVVRSRHRVHFVVGEGVVGDSQGLAPAQVGLAFLLVERVADDPQRDQQHTNVDDIAAVATSVASHQIDQRGAYGFAGGLAPRPYPADILLEDPCEHERQGGHAHEAAHVAVAQQEEHRNRDQRGQDGGEEVLAQRLERRPPPGEQRRGAHQQQQRKHQRTGDAVKVRRIQRDFVARDPLGDHREDRAQEHGERDD